MTNQSKNDIKEKIASIKEYIDTEICKKCEEMKNQLNELSDLLQQHKDNA